MPWIELLDQSSKTSLLAQPNQPPDKSTDKLYETNPIRLRHLLPRCPDPCHDIDGQRCQKESIAFAFSGRRYLARCQRICRAESVGVPFGNKDGPGYSISRNDLGR